MPATEIRILTERRCRGLLAFAAGGPGARTESFGEAAEEHRQTTVESAAERLATNPDDNFVFGAFHEGELVGMAGFFRYQIAKARHKGRIWGVYVRASCRGQGIGRALLIALLERVKCLPGLGAGDLDSGEWARRCEGPLSLTRLRTVRIGASRPESRRPLPRQRAHGV